MTEQTGAFALDQYAVTSCPVRTQNAFNPLLTSPAPADTQTLEHLHNLSHHRSKVMAFLRSHFPGDVMDLGRIRAADHDSSVHPVNPGHPTDAGHGDPADDQIRTGDLVIPPDLDKRAQACVDAMKAGVPIILNAELPVDWAHHRRGTADVLFKHTCMDGTYTYCPAVIKDHSVLTPVNTGERGQLISSLSAPFLSKASVKKYRYLLELHADYLLQLAHLSYLVSAAGFGSTQAWGAVIGMDHIDRNRGCDLAWIDLFDKQILAFSYTGTRQWKKYSPMSRYRHEQRFRVRVAAHALAQTGSDCDPELVTSPVHIPECDVCKWWPHCSTLLNDDISVEIERAPLDAREIMVLRRFGIYTVNDLAKADLDAILPEYLPLVAHRAGAENRLRLAAHRSQLLESGTKLERLTTGPITLPSAPIEIDLDIETSSGNHVYLWGFRVDDRRWGEDSIQYHPVYSFTSLTQAKELDLAEQAAAWLMDYIASVGDTPVLVWHYSNYEASTLHRFAHAKGSDSALGRMDEFSRTGFVDLLPFVKENFFGVNGLGLKAVATEGAGFTWRDPDPSGLNSQYWFAEAVHDPQPAVRDSAQARILRYNEDDVTATWALRRWMRSLT